MTGFVLFMIIMGALIAGARWVIKKVFSKIDERIIQANKNLDNGKVKIKQGKG